MLGLAPSSTPAQAAAGINQQINFQGRLLTPAGAVVPDGNYNMEFKIWQDGNGCVSGCTSANAAANNGGTLKWTEDWIYGSGSPDNRVTVKNGYYSVSLGSITAFGSNVDWNQDTLWLSMNVGDTSNQASFASSGGYLIPFKRLSSSVYALNSGQLGGLTSGQFVQLAQGVQTASTSTNPAIGINVTSGSGNIVTLQASSADVFDVTSSGSVLFGANADKTISVSQSAAATVGRAITITAGQGGTGAGSNGGTLTLQGGAGGGTTANGGNLVLDAGAAAGGGTVGTISIGTNTSSGITIAKSGVTTTVAGPLTVNNTGYINTNSTTALNVEQNGVHNNVLTVDTNHGSVGIDQAAPTSVALAVSGSTQTSNLIISGSSTSLNIEKNYTVGTGGVTAKDVVVLINDSGTSAVTDTTTKEDTRVMGVSMNTVAAAGSTPVVIAGNTQVTADTGAVNIGDQLVTSTTSGQVTVDNSATTGILGYATQSKAGGSSGVIGVYVHPVNGVTSPAFATTAGSTLTVGLNPTPLAKLNVNTGSAPALRVYQAGQFDNAQFAQTGQGVGNVNTNATTTVTGGTTSPLFTQYFRVGDAILVNAQLRTVSAIASDTSMTVSSSITTGSNQTYYNGVVGAGTVTTNGTTALTGSGTTFQSTFQVGDTILINGESSPGTITAIASNTSLTLAAAAATSAAGLSYARSNYDRLNIKANGNIGIGTNASAAALNIVPNGIAQTGLLISQPSGGTAALLQVQDATSHNLLNLTGSAFTVGNSTDNPSINLNTTGTGAVTIGSSADSSLIQIQGGSSGTTINDTSGNLTLSTTTSGTLAVSSAGALNLTGGAASTFNTGGSTLAITSSNFNVSTGGVLNVVGASAGYQIGGAASTGNYLRGNGTSFVSSAIQAGDIPVCSGTCDYIQNSAQNSFGSQSANISLNSSNGSHPTAQFTQSTDASNAVLFLQGGSFTNKAPNANLVQLQNSAGSNVLTIDGTGNLTVGSTTNVSTAGHLFADGFESGTAGAWVGIGGTGTGTIDGATQHTGKYSFKASDTNTHGAGYQATVPSSSTLYGRVYFDVTTLGNATPLMDLGPSAVGGSNHIVIRLGASGNLCYSYNGGADTCSSTAPATSTWHKLEAKYIAGTGANGTLQYWLDNVSIANVTTGAWTSSLTNFAIGGSDTVATATSTTYFDDAAADTAATGDAASLYVADNAHIAGSESVTGNSQTQFQVQNASGTAALSVDTTINKTTILSSGAAAVTGSELITTTAFNNVAWTSTGWSTTSTTAQHTTGNTNGLTTNQFSAVANANYQVTFTVTGSPTAGETVTPCIGAVCGQPVSGNVAGEVEVINAQGTLTPAVSFVPTSNWNGTISAVSVKLLTASNAGLAVTDATNSFPIEVRTSGVFGNTFIGHIAGSLDTTGSRNTATGDGALSSNTTGQENTASGFNSLQFNTTGNENAAFGRWALQLNVSGSNNTAVGFAAGLANTTGSGNTYIGSNASPDAAAAGALQNATAIGINSDVSQSDSLVLGCVNGTNSCTATTKVGIGTTAPSANLDVRGTVFSKVASASALQVQNTSNNQVLTVDTSGNQVLLGKGSTLAGKLAFQDSSDNNAITIQGAAVATAAQTWTLPTAAPTGAQCLGSAGSGASVTLQWNTCSGGGSGINNSTSTQSANFNVQAATSGTVAGVLQANGSGTADIMDLLNGSGVAVAQFGGNGGVTLKGDGSGGTAPISSVGEWDNNTVGITTLAISPHASGNLLMVGVAEAYSSSVSSISGGNATGWTHVQTKWNGGTYDRFEIWEATTNGTGSANISVTYTPGTPGSTGEIMAEEFTSSAGSSTTWGVSPSGTSGATTGTAITYASLTPTTSNEMYFGYGGADNDFNTSYSGTTGFNYYYTNWGDLVLTNTTLTTGTAYAPTAQGLATGQWANVSAIISATAPSGPAGSILSLKGSTGTTVATFSGTGSTLLQNVDIGSGQNLGGGGRLFTDSFESSNFEMWQNNPVGNSNIDSANARDGKYSAKFIPTSGNPAYITTPITSNSSVMMRGYAYVSSQTTGNANLMSLSNGSQNFTLYRDNSTGKLSFLNGVTSGTSVPSASSAVMSTGAWHEIELDLSIGSSTGTAQWYLDGNRVNILTAQNTGSTNISLLQIGDSTSSNSTNFAIDDVSVDTVRPGDSANLNVADSLHVSGTSSFGGNVVIQPGSDANFVFQVLNSSENDVFLVNSANNFARIGGYSGGTTTPGYLFVSDTSSNSGGNAQITGNWNSSNNWGIGSNSSGSDSTLRIGATSSSAGNAWNNFQNVNLVVTGTETVAPTSGNDSTAAFQVQNASSTNLFNVDTTNGQVNLGIGPTTPAPMGYQTVGSNAGSGYNGTINANQFTASYSGSISSMSVYVGANGVSASPNNKYQVGIYSDSGGAPGSLLVQSSQGTLNASAAWNTISLSYTLSAGTKYWLAYWTNTGSGTQSGLSGDSPVTGAAYCWQTQGGFGTMPSSYPSCNGGTSTIQHSMYVTYASTGYGATFASNGSVTVNGAATFADETNSSTAFQIQNASSISFFTVDTTNERIYVGPTTGDTTGAILVLGNKTNSGDPTGVAGAMYYNSNMGQFRCYTNAWHACGSVPIDQSYEIDEEWLTGSKTVAPVAPPYGFGSNNWAYVPITNCSGFTYGGGAGGVAVTTSRPGILVMNTTATVTTGCHFRLGSSGAGDAGNMVVGAGQDIKASAAVSSAAANTVMTRIGMDTQGAGTGRVNNGVWWEADGTANANWEYCYGTGAAATCASSGVAVTASTFVSLEIQVISSTAVTFIINHGTPIVLTGITLSSTPVFPDILCANSGTGATARSCYIDYYQLRGDGSSPR